MKHKKFKLNVLTLSLAFTLPSTFAAIPIDVSHKGVDYLKNYLVKPGFNNANKSSIQERSRATDFNNTLHVRAQQTYAGFPVWNSHIALHVNHANQSVAGIANVVSSANQQNTTMNGQVYQELDKDLQTAPGYLFTKPYADKFLQKAINFYQKEISSPFSADQHQQELMVYIDKTNKAHWAYFVKLHGNDKDGLPTMPTYIMDAQSGTVFEHWNDVRHLMGLSNVKGGGYGGNKRTGKFIYDGNTAFGHLPALDMQRDNRTNTCYLSNKGAYVYNFKTRELVHFNCIKTDPKHNNIYWNETFDMVNGGFSPSNDALYSAKVVNDLYETWYKIPVLTEKEAAMPIVMIMHTTSKVPGGFPEQAIWDPMNKVMFFGDGANYFYPLTTIDVGAHEISHGFTSQHSDLHINDVEAGGLDEAFSDMASQAAEYFVQGKTDWKIGGLIGKSPHYLFRYVDLPSRMCQETNGKPGEACGFDNMEQYHDYLKRHENDQIVNFETGFYKDNSQPDVHDTAGIFDRAFYLLATSKNWDVRKAFDVMVQANRYYWVANTTFEQAACGVLKATADYKYDSETVRHAFWEIGIDTNHC